MARSEIPQPIASQEARTAKLPNPIKGQFDRRNVPMIQNDCAGAAAKWKAWTMSDGFEDLNKPARLLLYGRLGRFGRLLSF
jgi:hypothetical protein